MIDSLSSLSFLYGIPSVCQIQHTSAILLAKLDSRHRVRIGSTACSIILSTPPPRPPAAIDLYYAHQRPLASMNVGNLLQLQTQVGHPDANRNQTHPVQTGIHTAVDSDDGPTSSSFSSDSGSQMDSLDVVRCSRCQRSLSIDTGSTSSGGVVRFGTNSYYCNRCATLVGFKK